MIACKRGIGKLLLQFQNILVTLTEVNRIQLILARFSRYASCEHFVSTLGPLALVWQEVSRCIL